MNPLTRIGGSFQRLALARHPVLSAKAGELSVSGIDMHGSGIALDSIIGGGVAPMLGKEHRA